MSMQQTQQVFKISDMIEVEGVTSELPVKAVIYTAKKTWKITATLTTQQISTVNEDVREATIQRMMQLVEEAVDLAIAKRKQLLELEEDTDQMKLPFGDGGTDDESDAIMGSNENPFPIDEAGKVIRKRFRGQKVQDGN